MPRQSSTFRTLLRRAALPGAAFAVVAFFGGYAVIGANGALAYSEYQRQLVHRQAVLDRLNHERAALANRVDLLDPRHANPDMVDELTRKELNVAHPDEVIVPLR